MTAPWPDAFIDGEYEFHSRALWAGDYRDLSPAQCEAFRADPNNAGRWRRVNADEIAEQLAEIDSPAIASDQAKQSDTSPPAEIDDPDHLTPASLAKIKAEFIKDAVDDDMRDLIISADARAHAEHAGCLDIIEDKRITGDVRERLKAYSYGDDKDDTALEFILVSLMHAGNDAAGTKFTMDEITDIVRFLGGDACDGELAVTHHMSWGAIYAKALAHYGGLWTERETIQAEDEEYKKSKIPPKFVGLTDFDESKLARRDWISDGFFERDNMSALAGQTGSGKSSISIGAAISIASGIPFGPFTSKEKYRVGMMNVEDCINEQQLRTAAMLKIPQFASLAAGRDLFRGLEIHTLECNAVNLVRFDPDSRKIKPTDTYRWLVGEIKRLKLDILFIDPLVEISEDIDENSNPMMHGVMALLRQIARSLHIHVCVIHHFNKVGGAMNVGAIRGASAIASSVRMMINIEKLTDIDAKALGIADDDRHDIVKMFSPKSNNARTGGLNYFRLVPQELTNGEVVASVEPHHLTHAVVDTAMVLEFLNKVAAGRLDNALPFVLSQQAKKHTRADCIMPGINAATVRQLMALGFLGEVEFRDAARHKATGLAVLCRPTPGDDWNPDPFIGDAKGDAASYAPNGGDA